jgi:hypothetical protein
MIDAFRSIRRALATSPVAFASRILTLSVIAVLFVLSGCSSSIESPQLAQPPEDARGPSQMNAETSDPAVTEAPDLVSVTNLRDGPDDSSGNPQTVVDFTFDQAAYLNNGDRSSFGLTPVSGGKPVFGRGTEPAGDEVGDDTVSVYFPGDLSASSFARGFVNSSVVNSAPNNTSADNPANVLQSQPLGGSDGITENPDLAHVTRDGDQVIFEFDEPISTSTGIQNTSGLRVFFPETSQSSSIRKAGAQVAKIQSPTVVRAYFGRDLPEGKSLADAVGAYVAQSTVKAESGSRGANDGKNPRHERAPLADTGADVCPASSYDGDTGQQSGPTEAPDLLAVGNVRRGPFTSQFTPTTCVDFVFDQVVYLNGGNRSDFKVIKTDGDDPLGGTTSRIPRSDSEGDVVVTVAFPGDFDASDVARGFVKSGIVNSEDGNVDNQNPANPKQTASVSPTTATQNPDLEDVERKGSAFYFTFDEDLSSEQDVLNTSGFRIYFPSTSQNATIPNAGSKKIAVKGPRTIKAKYGNPPEGFSVEDAVGAYVVSQSVQAATGSRGANDGKNAVDEVFFDTSSPRDISF